MMMEALVVLLMFVFALALLWVTPRLEARISEPPSEEVVVGSAAGDLRTV